MALSKSEKTVVLELLNLATRNPSQAEQAEARTTILGALGMSEDDASEHLANARDQAEQAAADDDGDDDAGAGDTPAS